MTLLLFPPLAAREGVLNNLLNPSSLTFMITNSVLFGMMRIESKKEAFTVLLSQPSLARGRLKEKSGRKSPVLFSSAFLSVLGLRAVANVPRLRQSASPPGSRVFGQKNNNKKAREAEDLGGPSSPESVLEGFTEQERVCERFRTTEHLASFRTIVYSSRDELWVF